MFFLTFSSDRVACTVVLHYRHSSATLTFHRSNKKNPSISESHPEAGGVWQEVFLRNLHLVHDEHSTGGGSQGELALDVGGGEALHPSLQEKAAHLPVVAPGPHHGQVGDGGVCDP